MLTIGDIEIDIKPSSNFQIEYFKSCNKICGIYCITNTNNGKMYIGQTINWKNRSSEHRRKLKRNKHNNRYLQRAYRKGQNFIAQFIENCSREQLDEREIFWIQFLKTMKPYGYNLSIGGKSPKGFKHSQKTKDDKRKWMLEYTKVNKIDNSDRYKAVLCYDLGTGGFVSEHVSIADAANKNNIPISSVSAALNGRAIAPYGKIFIFKTSDDYDKTINNKSYIDKVNNFRKNGALYPHIEQYLDNTLIKTWKIRKELLNYLNISSRALTQRLQRGKGVFKKGTFKYIRK